MSSLAEAFSSVEKHPWERKENPQKYTIEATQYVSANPQRHILGIVGGNDVSPIKGNMVDLESDLRGINIPNTFAPWRQYQPPEANQTKIVRDNLKEHLKINVEKAHLPTYQMWAYPGMPAPMPMKSEVCNNPEKY